LQDHVYGSSLFYIVKYALEFLHNNEYNFSGISVIYVHHLQLKSTKKTVLYDIGGHK